MSETVTTETLTTWAAGSESRAGEFVRTTLGPLLLILVTPPAAIIFWIVCTFEPFNGSLAPLLTAAGWHSVIALWPWPSATAAAIILIFVCSRASSSNGCPVCVVFLTILLTDRATRDDRRCRKKYGADWEEYCRRAPWKIIPGIY